MYSLVVRKYQFWILAFCYQRKLCFLYDMLGSENSFVEQMSLYLKTNEYKELCNTAGINLYICYYIFVIYTSLYVGWLSAWKTFVAFSVISLTLL